MILQGWRCDLPDELEVGRRGRRRGCKGNAKSGDLDGAGAGRDDTVAVTGDGVGGTKYGLRMTVKPAVSGCDFTVRSTSAAGRCWAHRRDRRPSDQGRHRALHRAVRGAIGLKRHTGRPRTNPLRSPVPGPAAPVDRDRALNRNPRRADSMPVHRRRHPTRSSAMPNRSSATADFSGSGRANSGRPRSPRRCRDGRGRIRAAWPRGSPTGDRFASVLGLRPCLAEGDLHGLGSPG